MSVTILLKKSSVNGKRPFSSDLTPGEIALNYSTADSGLYFNNTAGVIQKVGSVFVGTSAPNSAGTGSPGNALGELWYNPDVGITLLWDGANWCPAGAPVATTVSPGIVLAQTDPNGSAFENTFLGGSSGGSGATMVGEHNVAIGVLAMGGKTDEQRSVAIGHNALSNVNAGVSGGNIAIGSDTAISFTEGVGNIFLGFSAGQDNTTGCGNVLIGYGVKSSSPTISNELVIGNSDLGGPNYWICGDENRNVAFGAGLVDSLGLTGNSGQVLASTGDGVQWGTLPVVLPATPTVRGTLFGCSSNNSSSPVAIGFNALSSNTMGTANVAIGGSSLQSITMGSQNTAVGFESLKSALGCANTAVGWLAGCSLSATDANLNTFVGNGAGTGATRTSSNTFIGSGAGSSFLTGCCNTVVGASAVGSSGGLTGNGNVVIGHLSGNSLATTAASNVILGGWTEVSDPFGSRQLAIGTFGNLTWIRGDNTGAVKFANTILDSSGNPGLSGQYLSRNSTGGLVWINGVGSYVLPTATTSILGGVCVDGTTITVSPTGVISAGAQAVPSATPSEAGILYGRSSSAADGNTALGYHSLLSLTGGTFNTSIGRDSLNRLTSGTRNVSVGSATLSFLTSGSDNVAVGNSALGTSSSSSGNVAIGGCSLLAMAGNDPGNVAVGFCALNALNGAGAACRNVAVGCQSGLVLSSGRHNSFFGHASGRNVTTGCGNVVIGACVQVDDPAGSLQLVIGSNDWITSGTWIKGDSGFNVQIVKGLRDSTGALGTNGQTLTSTGTQTRWATTSVAAATPVVEGTVFARTCGAGVTSLGCQAGQNLPTTSSNVAVGSAALQNASGASTTGNVMVGHQAGSTLTSVCNSVAVGVSALRTAGAGTNNNTAIGAFSATSVGGSNNLTALGSCTFSATVTSGNLSGGTAVGMCALSLNTGGINTALGYFAGRTVNVGSLNTLVGSQAGEQITSGSNNTALGCGALRSGGTTNSNVAIGNNALSVGVPGNFNVALGYNSMCGGSTGAAGNVAIGATALATTTGGCNVAVGLNAGSNLTTGGNNVLIGPNVQAPSPTASGQMAIGYGTNYWIKGNTDKSVQFGAGIIDCNLSNGGAGYVLGSAGAAGVTWKVDGVLGNWWIRENGTNLDFRLVGNASVLMRLSNTGDLQVRGNITAFATLP